MQMRREDRALHERRENFRKQQIGHGAELVAGGGVAFDFHAQRTQLLDEAPDLGARNVKVAGEFSSAHNHRGVIHQQADDPAKAGVAEMSGRERLFARTDWGFGGDGEIMREG